MPESLTASEGQLTAIAQLPQIAPEIQAALESIAQRAENDFVVAYIDGYRSRLHALVNETSLLLGWIRPERPIATPASEKPAIDAEFTRRAKLAAGRLKQRQTVAELRGRMQELLDQGFPADASERELNRYRDERVRLFGEDNYVFGLSTTHRLPAAGWATLADAYRALANEAQGWTRRTTPPEAKDAERIAALKARFDAAVAPVGRDLTHDVDADWLATLVPAAPPAAVERDLATVDSLHRAIGRSRSSAPIALASIGPTGADRCRLKADVARAKGRLARAETRDRRDEDAALELARLQTRHRVEFHQDGYVFGFSAAHRMEPEAWEALAAAYDALADALERGVGSEADAEEGQAAIDRLRAVIDPIGRALRHDDDADDLQEEIRERHPRTSTAGVDPLAPFLPLAVPDDPAAANALAEAVLAAGVRPSDPRLREAFLEWVEELDDPALAPLARELEMEVARRQTQEDEAEPAAPDPAYLDLRERVRAVTRGKRILLVGGTNREDTRRAIEAELEATVEWPDSDEHKTKPASFDLPVDHADLVVKTRFCRRGYQRALERAKTQGKRTAALTGGYNPRQVVRALAESLRL